MYDLLDLLEDITRPAYTGPAPLGFTSRYFTPEQLLEARTELARIRSEWSKDHPTFGTWILGITTGWCATAPGHRLCLLQTDLRCRCSFPYLAAQWEMIGPCSCVGDLLYQANCPDCSWHHISSNESEAVIAWHDHAWPGWRDLPTLPAKLRGQAGTRTMKPALAAWLETHYPPEFRIDGAPILTDRPGRCVPGYSPYGGYDIATPQTTQ
ncbi:DUF6349 family protein [Microbacterium sp. NPDC055988]|uniref:DUF6349 family protein n=1 Tax=Microbacterium sp. NPDC055988 TaxID=3345671 RepID=UPI0035D5A59B